jgi:hypothetical protein
MYQDKVNSILVVNSYLTYYKMKNPQSPNVKRIQNYLTQKIGQTLETKKSSKRSLSSFYFLQFLAFLIR